MPCLNLKALSPEVSVSKPGSRRPKLRTKRGRMHDAEGTREAILNAAEEVFAAARFRWGAGRCHC